MTSKLEYASSFSSDSGNSGKTNKQSPLPSPIITNESFIITGDMMLLQCHNCAKTVEDIERLLKSLGSLQYDIRQIKSEISQVNEHLTLLAHKTPNHIVTEPDCKLPIENAEDLGKFENKLENSQFYETLVTILSRVSGSTDAKKLIHYIMKKLLSKNLSLQYSALGRKGKLNFSSLKCYKLVIDATRKNIPSCPEHEVRSHISSALAQAGDREGGRLLRKKN